MQLKGRITNQILGVEGLKPDRLSVLARSSEERCSFHYMIINITSVAL